MIGPAGRLPKATMGMILASACLLCGCASIKRMAINQVGDALAEGNSVFETDEDLELVGEALPFGLKLMESLLSRSPRHKGMLTAACRGFTSYSYAYVHFDAEVTKEQVDLDEGRRGEARARRLYLRARDYGLRALEESYEGITGEIAADPRSAAARVGEEDVPLLYWNAAALGLAISVSRGDAHMLVRIPEVEALLDRALELDEGWQKGSLHEFAIVLASAGTTFDLDAVPELRKHYERALALSEGRRASLFVTWAESVSVATQDAAEFREMLEHALKVDPDEAKEIRLMNLVSQRRARWLMGRIDDLFLDPEGRGQAGEEG